MRRNQFQCLSKRNKAQRDACLKSHDVQEVDIYVLEAKGLSALWVAAMKKQGLSEAQIDAKAIALGVGGFIASNGSAIHDVKNFYLLADDLKKGGSILSQYEITQNGNKSYIKFKGNHKLRSLIKGTRYLSNNAKMIALGVGKAGMKASAKAGVILTAIYSVAFRTLEFALTSNYTIANWISNISSDVVMAAIATVCGIIAGSFFMSSGIVVVPLFVMGVAAFAIGNMLDYLDGRYLIKEKLVRALNEHIKKQAEKEINNKLDRSISNNAAYQLRTSAYGVVL